MLDSQAVLLTELLLTIFAPHSKIRDVIAVYYRPLYDEWYLFSKFKMTAGMPYGLKGRTDWKISTCQHRSIYIALRTECLWVNSDYTKTWSHTQADAQHTNVAEVDV